MPPVRTILAHGESLTDVVPEGSFDIAYCSNALDHMYDPLAAIQSMLATVRPGGFVVLNHFVNEGKTQHYTGLHQWNIDSDGSDLFISNGARRDSVRAALADAAHVSCFRVQDPSRGARVECVIERSIAEELRLPELRWPTPRIVT